VSARLDPSAEVVADDAPAARAAGTAVPDDVHLHYAAIEEIDSRALAALPPAELARLPQTTRPGRRAQHHAGRALLRAALEDVTGRPALEHDLLTTAHGKPVCRGGPSISVSHSGRWVACASAPRLAVGVDVQETTRRRPVESIARTYFSDRENRWLATRPPESFYMLWVLKEAYLKALGVGLAGGLNALQCRIEPPVVEVLAARSDREPISLRLYALEAAFVALATADGKFGEIATMRWNPDGEPRWLPGRLRLIAATDR
jgi:4'-phosphopantetheinyl transferase